ncbi:MAG TPA: isoprenylcysteine carboxylmethyltransferase family protein [Anaerolineales bacterium]|nr:isoprenylcysteine carboxylmethyltransferase family protein [Anaerolineales bacterium]
MNRSLPLTPRVVVQLLIVVVLLPGLPVLITQRWDWWEAWAYAAVSAIGFVLSRVLAVKRSPDILIERSRAFEHANTEPWDRVLAPLVGIGGGVIPLIAALEALADPAPTYSLPVKLAALAALLGGYALGTWALVENTFFSGTVRIQSDRGHRVVSTGPYGWVRHPGYVGAWLAFAASAVILDGVWAWVAVAILTMALVVRTHLEDQTLRRKLVGYAEYAARVRYRLVPGIW